MADDRAENIVYARYQRDGHVGGLSRHDVGWQLLLDTHALDLEVMIVLAVIRNVERDHAGRERRRHVNVVFVLADVHDGTVGSPGVRLAIGGMLGTGTTGGKQGHGKDRRP